MARARAAEHQRPRSKTILIEEVTRGIVKLQEVLAAIKDLTQEGFPYRDAAQSKADLQFRECLRHTFGERSQEFETYRNFKIRTADEAETAKSIAVNRKLELQGLKPSLKSTSLPETSLDNHPTQMVPVSSATPTPLPEQTNSLMSAAVAITTDGRPSKSSPIPAAQSQPPTPVSEPSIVVSVPSPTPILTPPPPPSSTTTPIPATSQTHPPAAATFIPSRPSAPAAQPPPSAHEKPAEVVQASPPSVAAPIASLRPPQHHFDSPHPEGHSQPTSSERSLTTALALQDPPSDKQTTGLRIAQVPEPTPDQDPITLIRKVCLRFHSIARQLRLRRDYRPTLEVDDDYDVQDLLCALLKMEFDEVATDDWTPPYTEGAPRTTLLVNKDQIAIVAKKTRLGLTTKELTDQVTADSAYYRAQGRCSTLFCFMYDPEGRIGSPKRLETTLTSVDEYGRVEVLVAPK
jgi:hypothetical protein